MAIQRNNINDLRCSIVRRRLGGRLFISGTGRAGTSFLMQLLTELGLDTGYSRDFARDPFKIADKDNDRKYFSQARAGFERDPFCDKNPMIVKCPTLCDSLDDVLSAGIKVGHLVIPVRNIADAAESRRFVQNSVNENAGEEQTPGGLWGTRNLSEQEAVLSEKFGRLIESAVRNEVPMTFLSFPRLAIDADYTFEKIRFLCPLMHLSEFRRSFSLCSNPSLIHDFRAGRG